MKDDARSVGADVSQEIFEQHVHFFGIHVLAHVVDPYHCNVGIPAQTINYYAGHVTADEACTHPTQSSTLLTLFHTSLRMGSILSGAGLQSQHTVPRDANSWLRGMISSAVWRKRHELEVGNERRSNY